MSAKLNLQRSQTGFKVSGRESARRSSLIRHLPQHLSSDRSTDLSVVRQLPFLSFPLDFQVIVHGLARQVLPETHAQPVRDDAGDADDQNGLRVEPTPCKKNMR